MVHDNKQRRAAMRVSVVFATVTITATIASGMMATTLFAQSNTSGQTKCYPPQYDASSDLLLPQNFHEWIYVGSPLTPNALNGGQAGFPEYHNVYIEPCSYET